MKVFNRGVKSGLLLLTIIMVSAASLSAQVDERTIKLSGNYLWGEGFGEDRQTAVNNAKRDLIERLQVRIESEANFTERDTNDDYSVELETTTNTLSRMELRGLNYMPAKERRDGSWETIAYITKDDFNTTMDLESDRLLSALKIAIIDENDGRLDVAITQYMELWASTFYSPVPFYTNADDHGIESELRSFLSNKIRNWVNTLAIDVDRVRSLSTAQNSEFYFDLLFSYNEMATSNLEIALNKSGYVAHPIRNGRTSIFYDLAPEERIRSFNFTLSPVIPNSIDQEKAAILDGVLPIREITLDIDFSDVIDINFNIIEESENTFTFVPILKNLSVYSLEWDFGDGETSKETTPTHDFGADFTGSLISLIINSSGDLLEQKQIGEIEKIDNTDNIDELGFVIPPNITSYVENTIRLKDGNSLTKYLNNLSERNILMVGRQSDINNPTLSYLAIINPQDNLVIAILSPVESGMRYNLITNETISNSELRMKFRGLGSVWFQFK